MKKVDRFTFFAAIALTASALFIAAPAEAKDIVTSKECADGGGVVKDVASRRKCFGGKHDGSVVYIKSGGPVGDPGNEGAPPKGSGPGPRPVPQ